jgi:integrase
MVKAVQPLVSRQVWAMIELQGLTGMRPGEVVLMRTSDLEMTGDVWTYTPHRHKTEHHGKKREVLLGPRAREILQPWLKSDLDAYLFSPAEAMAERQEQLRQQRKTSVQPSQCNRRKARPKKAPGAHYTVASYRRAIQVACHKAGIPKWHPYPAVSRIFCTKSIQTIT